METHIKKTRYAAALRIIAAIFIGLLLGGVFSCSPQKQLNRKIKRAERFAKKHDLTILDTVRITDVDTFVVQSYNHDTVQQFVHHDTHTVINNERVKLLYRYDTITNEIWHHVECKGDTIIQKEEHTITTEKIKHLPSQKKWYDYLKEILLLAVLFFIIRQYLTKNN